MYDEVGTSGNAIEHMPGRELAAVGECRRRTLRCLLHALRQFRRHFHLCASKGEIHVLRKIVPQRP